jgi:hypothetical protein
MPKRSYIPRGGFGFHRGASRKKDPLRANLVGYYRLGDTSDSSGNGYTLTNVGGTVSFANDGLAGKCATFDGTSHLSVSGAAGPLLSPAASSAFGLAVLWRVGNNATNNGIVSKGGAATREWNVYHVSGNGLLFEIFNGVSTARLSLADYSGLATGNPANNAYVLTFAWFDPAGGGGNGVGGIQGCNIGGGQTALNTIVSAGLSGLRAAPNTGAFEIGARYGSFKTSSRIDTVAVWSGSYPTLAQRELMLSRAIAGQELIK